MIPDMVKEDKPLITSSSSPVTWCGNHYQKQEELVPTSPLKSKEIAPPPFYPFPPPPEYLQHFKPTSP
jgi:hypothetical protein